MNIKYLVFSGTALFLSSSCLALQVLDDEALSVVQGQSGLTVEQSQLLNIGELTYSDDGNDLSIEGLRFSSQDNVNEVAHRTYVLDASQDGALRVQTEIKPTQMHIDAIRINDSTASFGDFTLNYEAVTNFSMKGMPLGGFEGDFEIGISKAQLIWKTNGHSLSFENIGYNAKVDNYTFEYDVIDNTKEQTRSGLNLGMENFDFSFSTGAVSLGSVSLGELSGDLALSANLQMFGGGRYGTDGLTLHSNVNILANPSNYVRFTDYDAQGQGNSLSMEDFSGAINLTNLTLDVEAGHLAIGFDQLDGAFKAGTILIGDSSQSIGGIELDFLLNDDAANNRFNRFQLYPGIIQPNLGALPAKIRGYAFNFYKDLNAASEGLSIASQWNLANADLSYIDDGRRVIFSGLKSFGSANTTFDVRDKALAIGMTDLKGSYSIDGLRVGDKTAPLQGGAELLLSLEVFQAMDFEINGYTTITAGGAEGGGIRINGDYYFSNTNIGLSIDENGQGIWATDVNYDIHLRDITFDVEDDGLKMNRGEQWSTMDIANLRWGDKAAGRSLGRIKLERFEQGSSLAIMPGGAGEVCVGASGSNESSCGSAGGRWEDRGEQGMTIALKAAFANAGSTTDGTATARNRLTWENNRTERSPGSGKYINGTGTQIIFDNYSTNDGRGPSDTNNHGLQANLSIDVFETKVLKKTSGDDANGISGDFGDELIYENIGTASEPVRGNQYTYVASPTAQQKVLRPLGFAVKGNVSFKELNIGAVQLKHPTIAAPQAVFHGVVMQNLNLTTNLTATPIQ